MIRFGKMKSGRERQTVRRWFCWRMPTHPFLILLERAPHHIHLFFFSLLSSASTLSPVRFVPQRLRWQSLNSFYVPILTNCYIRQPHTLIYQQQTLLKSLLTLKTSRTAVLLKSTLKYTTPYFAVNTKKKQQFRKENDSG